MPRNIVVGYDGSRSSNVAVEQAINLAELGDGRIYLATVTAATEDDIAAEVPGGEPELAELATEPVAAEEADADGRHAVEYPLSLDEIHRRCQDLHIVCEEEHLFGRHAGARLLRRSWLAELLVIGRGDERRPGRPGANTTFLLSELVAPTLVCARQATEIRSVLIPYKLSVRGGRGLSFAARLCETLNAELEVLICEPKRSDAHDAREAAEKFLRAYRVESSTDVALSPPHEAVQSAAMDRESSLVIIPGAHKRNYLFPWQRNETLWRALEVPGAAVLAYP
ncbi:MAG: universal stress protein [Armatimonadota bacterium]